MPQTDSGKVFEQQIGASQSPGQGIESIKQNTNVEKLEAANTNTVPGNRLD